jgi:hypothetical protein
LGHEANLSANLETRSIARLRIIVSENAGSRKRALECDRFKLKRPTTLTIYWSMIFSENRIPLFRIMLEAAGQHTIAVRVTHPFAARYRRPKSRVCSRQAID